VYRYERFWLPFLKNRWQVEPEKETDFAPPIDIYWIWHVHMLSPKDYQGPML
jgi:hypothetical protein